jgi:hypothetical protein
MLSSTLKTASSSKRARSFLQQTLPQSSTGKSSKKYYTPYKSSLPTTHTNHNTLSLYSVHSRKPAKHSLVKAPAIV